MRVKLDRASWAAAGFSAGAWCAAMVALLHPSRYGAALIFGGYFHPVFSPTYVPFTPGSAQWRRYDLVALIKRAPPPLAIWMEVSHSDHGSYRTSAAFLAAARPPMSVRLVEFAHASHTILFWAPLVPQAIRWLETIRGFRASPDAGSLRATTVPGLGACQDWLPGDGPGGGAVACVSGRGVEPAQCGIGRRVTVPNLSRHRSPWSRVTSSLQVSGLPSSASGSAPVSPGSSSSGVSIAVTCQQADGPAGWRSLRAVSSTRSAQAALSLPGSAQAALAISAPVLGS